MAAEANVRVIIDGGWGVDALLGEQTRSHSDLDIIMDVQDLPDLLHCCIQDGYRRQSDGTPENFVLQSKANARIDVHAIRFDDRGYGLFQFPDGRIWPFPPAAFAAQGNIAGRKVLCLSPDAQVQCHGQGYQPTTTDIDDMEKLQQTFGVVLPVNLCRQSLDTPSRLSRNEDDV